MSGLDSCTWSWEGRQDGERWSRVWCVLLCVAVFQGRTDGQCQHRWQKVLNPELVKGPWTKEEDQKVRGAGSFLLWTERESMKMVNNSERRERTQFDISRTSDMGFTVGVIILNTSSANMICLFHFSSNKMLHDVTPYKTWWHETSLVWSVFPSLFGEPWICSPGLILTKSALNGLDSFWMSETEPHSSIVTKTQTFQKWHQTFFWVF